jgi:transposase-like protein
VIWQCLRVTLSYRNTEEPLIGVVYKILRRWVHTFKVRGRRQYLYRAIHSYGGTVEFWFSE